MFRFTFSRFAQGFQNLGRAGARPVTRSTAGATQMPLRGWARALSVAAALVALPVAATADDMMKMGSEVTVGTLVLSGAFSRATLPNAPVAGGFLTIHNTGTEDDRLIAAASPAAGHMEVHEMAMEGDVMKMRELADGLPIPAGETVELKPGGYHVMFMDLQQPLVEGETVMVTLTFETAGSIEIPLAIGAPNAGAHGEMNGMDMDHSMDHGALDSDLLREETPAMGAPFVPVAKA